MKVSFIFLIAFLVAICFVGSKASETQEELVRVARADSRPHLPRPTSRPPGPIFNKPRRADSHPVVYRLESIPPVPVRQRRADSRPHLPRPTPRPPGPIHIRQRRADSRPHLPRPTSRPPGPIFNRPRRALCSNSSCRTYCKTRHPAYSGRCVNGQCDCS